MGGGLLNIGTGNTPPTEKQRVTADEATQIFNDMADEADIAFNYPIDGCYARAYLMVERIQDRYGVTPSKVWAFTFGAGLSVQTDTVYGRVTWSYHVAPVIPVGDSNGVEYIVIDPSIAKGPLAIDQRVALMNDPSANIQITPLGQAPLNPVTSDPLPGDGYWPGQSPGDPAEYSLDVMQHYKLCGEKGVYCDWIQPN